MGAKGESLPSRARPWNRPWMRPGLSRLRAMGLADAFIGERAFIAAQMQLPVGGGGNIDDPDIGIAQQALRALHRDLHDDIDLIVFQGEDLRLLVTEKTKIRCARARRAGPNTPDCG